MHEAYGYRAALHWRIKAGNITAYSAGACTVVLGLLILAGELAEFGVLGAGVCLGTALAAVRFVTWCRVELYKLGPPGPRRVS
jgi:hypothetical protein